ncbi:MAG: hypothetical protein QXX99_08180 [Candidatus Bathyarchaeia archaeon]
MSFIDEVLFLDGSRYRLHEYRSEEEIRDIVREHYLDLFGSCSIYFDFEPRLRLMLGSGRSLTAAFLLFRLIPAGLLWRPSWLPTHCMIM